MSSDTIRPYDVNKHMPVAVFTVVCGRLWSLKQNTEGYGAKLLKHWCQKCYSAYLWSQFKAKKTQGVSMSNDNMFETF